MKHLGVLLAIVVLAAGLRVWHLSVNPPGLTWDEAALGYNAYSILQTGRDEYGKWLPLTLKSFGDYKPALYVYFDIPFVAVFGLTETAIRLPSVLAGVGLVILIYLLLMELTKERRLALLGALMSAISPLAIQFSRPAFESNVALFFNVLGTLLFLQGLRKRFLLPLSVLSFSVSLFTYQSSRLFVPLLILGLVFFYRKKLFFDKWVKLSGAFLVFLTMLTMYLVFGLGQSNRLAVMNFFAYRRSEEIVNQISREDGLPINSLDFQILHGEWWSYVRGLGERYLIYFSPKTLFVNGDYNQRDRVPDLGVLYYFSVVLIPLGFVLLWRYSGAKLIFFWLALAPLPGVLSRDLITTLRSLNLLLPLSILEGAGLFYLGLKFWQWGRKRFYLFIIAAVLVMGGNLLIYFDRYFIHAPKEYSQHWLYGYKEAVSSLVNFEKLHQYNRVVMTDTYGQPYIYYLFYSRYDPARFQKQAVLDQPGVDVGTVRKIDNIEFRHIYWPKDRFSPNNLYIGTLEELPDKDVLFNDQYQMLGKIRFLDNLLAFRIVSTK